jgi:hypothetical protein
MNSEQRQFLTIAGTVVGIYALIGVYQVSLWINHSKTVLENIAYCFGVCAVTILITGILVYIFYLTNEAIFHSFKFIYRKRFKPED